MPISYTELPNSTFLDYESYRSGSAPLSGGTSVAHNFTINVALVFDRANDPTALLNSNWASRQQQLDALNDSGTLWTTYGANPNNYSTALAYLGPGAGSLNLPTLDASNSGYVSSAASRTIWVQLDESNFTTLFGSGATLMSTSTPSSGPTWFWNGSLSLPSTLTALGVSGLWFDTTGFSPVLPDPENGVAASLPQGWQSLGNGGRSFGGASLSEPHREQLLQFPPVGRAVGHRADQRDRPHRTGGRHRPAEHRDPELCGAGRRLSCRCRHHDSGLGHVRRQWRPGISARQPASRRRANARSMSVSSRRSTR